jgi:hypothetical protein
VAALGAVFQSRIASELSTSLPQAPSGFSDAVSSGATDQAVSGAPPQFRDQALNAANHAFVTAFNEILLIGAAVCIVGGILGLAMVRQRDFVASGEAAAEPAAA